ncbi:MAG: hypothetical protein JSR76_00520 [Verrucomicrobia bacterium]|nr:hypothetical protein [Verrucomicrobiota bacterium]
MNLLLSIVIHTANILGIFTDPFEFDGDYGPEVNPTRQHVFALVVSKEALAKNLSDLEIREKMERSAPTEEEVSVYKKILVMEAIHEEKVYGSLLGKLVTAELLQEIKKHQNTLSSRGFTESDFRDIVAFIERYKDQKVFRFLRNTPSELLSLDKALRDKAARDGKIFNLPILGSTKALQGTNGLDLKKNLVTAVFTEETFTLTKPQNSVKEALKKLSDSYLREFFGESADTKDLEAFSSPLGQVFFYWMYQALNLELISSNSEMIAQVNKVKDIFAKTLGDPVARANGFKDKLMASDAGLLFTQESDALVPEALTNDGLFLPIDRQNRQDGTLILLRGDLWESNYEIVSIDGYDGYTAGRMNLILATRKNSGQQFLLASCHGHSTKSEDGRLQIELIMQKFHQLNDGSLQLLIGIDANTKTEEDVKLFKEHLERLGLVSTQAGPTTIKKRMVTAQHSKAGRFAIDEEDYLITLKPELGGQFQFSHVAVGFKEESVDIKQPLPNIDNPSDHYPVSAVITPL